MEDKISVSVDFLDEPDGPQDLTTLLKRSRYEEIDPEPWITRLVQEEDRLRY